VWRTEADLAELNPSERGAAPRAAARLGYLEPFAITVQGVRLLACAPSAREKGKNGRILAYRRTEQPVPEHMCRVEAS
jgi:hypothetical protein